MTSPQPLPPRLRAEMQPVSKAPTLTRLNGFGWILMGSRDAHPPSDTYVATRVFCALFIPVFPTDAWRVRKIGLYEWTFLGKVPLSPLASRLQKVAMLAAAVLIIRGVWPAPAPKTTAAGTPSATAEEPIFTPVPLTAGKDREGAPELSAWVAQEQVALRSLRDSSAAVEAAVTTKLQRLEAIERQLASLPPAAHEALLYERTSVGAALNQLYGSRRMLLHRTRQREQELADSVRAFDGR